MLAFFPSVNARFATVLAAGLFLLAAGGLRAPAWAQQSETAADEDSQAARFRLATRYLDAGESERAIALLEDLYDESPATLVFYQKLKEAYEGQKRFDDAVALVERAMNQRGRSPGLLSEKARLQYHSDAGEAAAFATWDAALDAAPGEEQTYRTVYRSLMDVRLFQRAVEAVRRGREALGDPALMRLQLAYLYNLTSRHGEAIDEYLAMVKATPDRLNFAKSRLGRFLDQEQALQESIAATSRAVRDEPLVRPYRELMGWLYLQADEHEKALRAYRAVDRLEDAGGRLLYAFAGQAADAGAYQAALDAYRIVRERHPDAPSAPGALRGMGRMYEAWAEDAAAPDVRQERYEEALDAYRAFLEQYPTHESYPSVLRAVGRVQQDVLFDLDAAEETLREVARRYPRTEAADLAQYDLGRLQVMRGDLVEARLAFSRLTDRLGASDLAQRARYEQALLHFYQGEFESAATLLGPLAESTDADVSNDGITLGVLLSENAAGRDTTGQAMRLFARARLAHRRRQTTQTHAFLDELLQQHARSALADDARFFRARTLAEQDRPAEAADAYAQVALTHPRSTLADRSLFEAARLQETVLEDPEAALQTYRRLLRDYPGSLHAAEARTRIQALRAEAPAS